MTSCRTVTTAAAGPRATYQSWRNMVQRCTNPNRHDWDRYGGRGVALCDRWRRFDAFLADMGRRPRGKTLDRVDVDGDYEPGNCRWATLKQQAQNQRRSTCRTR